MKRKIPKEMLLFETVLCLLPTPESGSMRPISEMRRLRIREFKRLAKRSVLTSDVRVV